MQFAEFTYLKGAQKPPTTEFSVLYRWVVVIDKDEDLS